MVATGYVTSAGNLYCKGNVGLKNSILLQGIFMAEAILKIKKGSTLVCSAHFKPDDMYKTITRLTCLRHGVVPSQFAWTKEGKEH